MEILEKIIYCFTHCKGIYFDPFGLIVNDDREIIFLYSLETWGLLLWILFFMCLIMCVILVIMEIRNKKYRKRLLNREMYIVQNEEVSCLDLIKKITQVYRTNEVYLSKAQRELLELEISKYEGVLRTVHHANGDSELARFVDVLNALHMKITIEDYNVKQNESLTQ